MLKSTPKYPIARNRKVFFGSSSWQIFFKKPKSRFYQPSNELGSSDWCFDWWIMIMAERFHRNYDLPTHDGPVEILAWFGRKKISDCISKSFLEWNNSPQLVSSFYACNLLQKINLTISQHRTNQNQQNTFLRNKFSRMLFALCDAKN